MNFFSFSKVSWPLLFRKANSMKHAVFRFNFSTFSPFLWLPKLCQVLLDALILYNYPPKGRWMVVDIYRDAKCRVIYPLLFTDTEGDSCFSIYQIRWIKKCCFNFFFWNLRETTRDFSLRSQNSEYPRICRVTRANQNARILLCTDLVNTNNIY